MNVKDFQQMTNASQAIKEQCGDAGADRTKQASCALAPYELMAHQNSRRWQEGWRRLNRRGSDGAASAAFIDNRPRQCSAAAEQAATRTGRHATYTVMEKIFPGEGLPARPKSGHGSRSGSRRTLPEELNGAETRSTRARMAVVPQCWRAGRSVSRNIIRAKGITRTLLANVHGQNLRPKCSKTYKIPSGRRTTPGQRRLGKSKYENNCTMSNQGCGSFLAAEGKRTQWTFRLRELPLGCESYLKISVTICNFHTLISKSKDVYLVNVGNISK